MKKHGVCLTLFVVIVLISAGCAAASDGSRSTVAVLINLSDSAMSNPRLARWKLVRALDRVNKIYASNDIGLIAVGGKDQLSKNYAAGPGRKGGSMLSDFEDWRRLQVAAQVKLGEQPTAGASGVQADAGNPPDFGRYTDHATAFALAAGLRRGSGILTVVVFTDGFDEDPDGSTGMNSFSDLSRGLDALFATGKTRLVALGPGPETPDPALGTQMGDIWKQLLNKAASAEGASSDDSFVVAPDYLDLTPQMLVVPTGERNGTDNTSYDGK